MTYRVAIGASLFAAEDSAPTDLLREKGIEFVPNPYGRRLTEDEIIEHLRGMDGLIAGLEPLNRRVLSSAAPKLKALARVGIGVSNIDLEAAEELGVKVSNTPEPPTQPVAELTVAAMLALCRGLVRISAAFHAGGWPKEVTTGLIGTNVLLIGYGRIGRRVAQMLQPFGARILVADPFIDPASLTGGEQLVGLEEGLAQARVISLHLSGEDVLLGPEQFERMRDGVVLLNSARGGLVDEDALIEALESGKVAGAWFDAFWDEPYHGRLVGMEQVLLTPHAGTFTFQCRRQMEVEAVENLLRDLEIPA